MNQPSPDLETTLVNLDVVADAAEMSALAAEIVARTIHAKPDAAICLPTGSTPLGMFGELAAMSARGEVDFSRVELYCLDEYVGVDRRDPNSLTGWLWTALVTRVGIDPERVHVLPTMAEDPIAAAAAFDQELVGSGGLDLAVLGLGPNGHIGYNEPGSSRASRTRVIELTPESINQAAAYWSNTLPVPAVAMTLGVGTLLEAKRILLIVSGETKATILRRTLEAQPDAEVPASWLRFAGARLTVIADQRAAAELTMVPTP